MPCRQGARRQIAGWWGADGAGRCEVIVSFDPVMPAWPVIKLLSESDLLSLLQIEDVNPHATQ